MAGLLWSPYLYLPSFDPTFIPKDNIIFYKRLNNYFMSNEIGKMEESYFNTCYPSAELSTSSLCSFTSGCYFFKNNTGLKVDRNYEYISDKYLFYFYNYKGLYKYYAKLFLENGKFEFHKPDLVISEVSEEDLSFMKDIRYFGVSNAEKFILEI